MAGDWNLREDLFYSIVCILGRPVLWLCSRPVVLHRERAKRSGGFLIAANHLSPFDVACVMNTTRRHIDFVSIVEMFEKPFVGWFFGALNAMPLDRRKVDSSTIRSVVERLARGRVVGIFPEGGIRSPEKSVLNGGTMRSGIGRIAALAEVPILPCVVLDSANFRPPTAWLPFRHTRYAVAYGNPIFPPTDPQDRQAHRAMEKAWLEAVRELSVELTGHLNWHAKKDSAD